ncbi:hypothetical protein [Marinitenerispora sediminis]|nr:hypothetical protein [Marinitenerispora sediminis]
MGKHGEAPDCPVYGGTGVVESTHDGSGGQSSDTMSCPACRGTGKM